MYGISYGVFHDFSGWFPLLIFGSAAFLREGDDAGAVVAIGTFDVQDHSIDFADKVVIVESEELTGRQGTVPVPNNQIGALLT